MHICLPAGMYLQPPSPRSLCFRAVHGHARSRERGMPDAHACSDSAAFLLRCTDKEQGSFLCLLSATFFTLWWVFLLVILLFNVVPKGSAEVLRGGPRAGWPCGE